MGAQESCGRTWHTFRICLLARYLILWYAGGPAKIFPTVFFPKRFFKLASCDCDSCSKCEFSHLTLTTRFQNIRSRTDQNHPAT
ncbi:hypothetical protein CISIN_1g035489mg [Citrus sinensis]|uniref:Uncharacterized protein n=1 Tax=Citrus sinensis TaxID=2711 RepID=A0A067GDQ1_CITSI|nr:hypothetical protein CISIN_1g035489mg [Citrus sinensis]